MQVIKITNHWTIRPRFNSLLKERLVLPNGVPSLRIVHQLLQLPRRHWSTCTENILRNVNHSGHFVSPQKLTSVSHDITKNLNIFNSLILLIQFNGLGCTTLPVPFPVAASRMRHRHDERTACQFAFALAAMVFKPYSMVRVLIYNAGSSQASFPVRPGMTLVCEATAVRLLREPPLTPPCRPPSSG